MANTSFSVRELRNQFPKVRKIIETEGEVLLTERGKPKYRLSAYSPRRVGEPAPIDYWERLQSYQPRELSRAESDAVNAENRGGR